MMFWVGKPTVHQKSLIVWGCRGAQAGVTSATPPYTLYTSRGSGNGSCDGHSFAHVEYCARFQHSTLPMQNCSMGHVQHMPIPHCNTNHAMMQDCALDDRIVHFVTVPSLPSSCQIHYRYFAPGVSMSQCAAGNVLPIHLTQAGPG